MPAIASAEKESKAAPELITYPLKVGRATGKMNGGPRLSGLLSGHVLKYFGDGRRDHNRGIIIVDTLDNEAIDPCRHTTIIIR
jgi:hypothetical protein